MTYLTIGSLLKGEDSVIEDFVKYHMRVGVEKFVFLDRTVEPTKTVLAAYPNVEIIHFPEIPQNTHMAAWTTLINHMRGKTKWLACIDADEALVPVISDSVAEILLGFEDWASVRPNWHTFGSSGQETRLPGSYYERFTMRANADWIVNRHVQFICQPDRVNGDCPNPHFVCLNPGEKSCNTHKQEENGPFCVPHLHDVLWIAHYYTRSREEWNFKISKNRADIHGLRHDELYDEYNKEANKIRETRVLDLWNSR